MKIMTVAKLAALGGAAYYVKKQGGLKPAWEKLKESMKQVAEQAKPAFEEATGGSMSSGVGSSTGIGESPRSGSTYGNKTNY